MAEVKDKLITAESLKAVYDANKQAISQLSDETAELKSDLNGENLIIEWELGGIGGTGIKLDNNKRIRTVNNIKLDKYLDMKLSLTVNEEYEYIIICMDSNGLFNPNGAYFDIADLKFTREGTFSSVDVSDLSMLNKFVGEFDYIGLVIRKKDDSEMSVSDGVNVKLSFNSVLSQIKELSEIAYDYKQVDLIEKNNSAFGIDGLIKILDDYSIYHFVMKENYNYKIVAENNQVLRLGVCKSHLETTCSEVVNSPNLAEMYYENKDGYILGYVMGKTPNYKNPEIKVYEKYFNKVIKNGNLGCVNVSAYDSSQNDKDKSDYICTGTNDEIIIQKAIDSLPNGGKVILAIGTYNIDGFCFEEDGYKVAFGERGGSQRTISIQGINPPCRLINSKLPSNTAIINVRNTALSKIEGFNGRVSLIGYNGSERLYPKYGLCVKNLNIMLSDNQHNIIAIDGKFFSQYYTENVLCLIYSTGTTTNGADYEFPIEKCVAFRGTDGSNFGMGYRMSNCFAMGFGVAYDINGEHLIMEQCGCRFCDYTYRFGYDKSNGFNYHDITLINCSHEMSRRFPYFADTGDKYYQSISFINYNSELMSTTDFAHQYYAQEETNGNYFGDVTYTSYGNRFFEEESGSNFKVRRLDRKLSGEGLPTCYDEGTTYYNKTDNKLYYYINRNWIQLN